MPLEIHFELFLALLARVVSDGIWRFLLNRGAPERFARKAVLWAIAVKLLTMILVRCR